MKAQVGKSTGLALLLAAGLLAALFATSLFAPAGVDAGVKGFPKPVFTLSNYGPGAEEVTATFTFALNDAVDGAALDGGTDDNVIVELTGFLIDNPADIEPDDVTVTQNGVKVGSVSSVAPFQETVGRSNLTSLRVTITRPAEGDKLLEKDIPTVVTIKGLTLKKRYVDEPVDFRINQNPTPASAARTGVVLLENEIVDASFTRRDGDRGDGLGINDAGAKVDVDITFRMNGESRDSDSSSSSLVLTMNGFNLNDDDTSVTVQGAPPTRTSSNPSAIRSNVTTNGRQIFMWGPSEAINPETEIRISIKDLRNPSATGKYQFRVRQGDLGVEHPVLKPVIEELYISKPADFVISELALDETRAGEPATMTFQFRPYVSTTDDTVTVTLDGAFGGQPALAVTQEKSGQDESVGKITPSKDGYTFTIGKAEGDDAHNIWASDVPVKVTLSGLINPPDDGAMDSVITVRQGQFLPASAPFTFTPAPVEPAASLSSYNAGADVRVDLFALAGNTVRGGSNINVTLPGFGIPSDLAAEDVLIYSNDYDGAPSNVLVSDSTVAITVPVRTTKGEKADPDSDTTVSRTTAITGEYEIRFKSSAGLTNPTSGGEKTIKVSDSDAADHEFAVTIDSTVKVSPAFVARGETTTVTVTGVRDGAVSVHLGDLADRDEDNDGPTLGTARASNGVAEIEINTAGSTLKAGATASGDLDLGLNQIYVLNAANDPVGGVQHLGLKPTVALGADSAKRAGKLEISVSDWYYGDINEVTIGGIEVTETKGDTINVGSDNRQTFEVTVPGDVRLGRQKVSVTGNDKNLNNTSAEATVNISAIALTVTPAEVVPGQQVTITGSGFTGGDAVDRIALGGIEPILPDDARSTSSGAVAVTVEVPLAIGPGAKPVALTVGTRTGEGQITVAQPAISISPEESLIGTRISVTGSGFASGGRVEVEYAGRVESVGEADSNGNIAVRLTVPSDAGIGSTNIVEVKVRGAETIKATAMHRTPGPRITVSPEAPVGGTIIITGTSFKSFSVLESVEIGDQNAKPSPAPETDQNGNFQFEARVPRLGVGSHTVTVEDGDQNTATETFTVIDTPVVSTPAEVFAPISEMLTVVWRYDNATGSWASYSPTGPAELNDLTAVTGGVIVWIQLTQRAEFQGQSLNSGWQLITLE